MFKHILLATLIALALCKDPPILSASFQVSFDQTVIKEETSYTVNGQMFYDANNNRERVDRTNGRYDLICGSVLPNVTTPCNQVTVSNRRYVIFPQRRMCCFCCDSAHGCGILRQDWLKGAQYLGTQKLVDTVFDKWQQKGGSTNYWWATTDDKQKPRKLQQGKSPITNYIPLSYQQKKLDDSIFQLPSYCDETSCPLTSVCGYFREKAGKVQE